MVRLVLSAQLQLQIIVGQGLGVYAVELVEGDGLNGRTHEALHKRPLLLRPEFA
jgi:hypothetical protein